MLNAADPPAEAAPAHSWIVTLPGAETYPDHTAPVPGDAIGDAATAMPGIAPLTAVVFCTQLPAAVASENAALFAAITCAIGRKAPPLYEQRSVCEAASP